MVSVGSEIVSGQVDDTNARWLARRLGELGADVAAHVAVGDDAEALASLLRFLLERAVADVVVVGGGLGPTHDDITREGVAEAAGVPLEPRADLERRIAEAFAAHGRRMPAVNLRQARIPRGASVLPAEGTAPGFRLEVERGAGAAVLYVLPGVPWELRAMFDSHVAADVLRRAGARVTLSRVVHVTGSGESAVAEALGELLDRLGRDGPQVSLRATGREIEVMVTASGDDPASVRAHLDAVVDEALRLLGPAAAGVDDEDLAATVVRLLRAAGATVATAESVTAGAVAARLGAVAGASDVLAGGVVVYATRSKHDVLGVPDDLLDAEGPVSEPVTRELAERVRRQFEATYGLGVTGVAGPAPQSGRPVGTAFWALAGPDGTHVRGDRFPGDRAAVQERVASAALEALRRRLLGPP